MDAASTVRRYLHVMAALWAIGASPAAHPSSESVVVLFGSDPAGPSAASMYRALRRSAQEQRRGVSLEFFEEHLDIRSIPRQHYEDELVRWLNTKYADIPIAAVLPQNEEALRFVLRSRDRLWTGKPVVFFDVGARLLDILFREAPAGATRDVTGVTVLHDIRGTLELAKQLFPDTRQVATVLGRAVGRVPIAAIARQSAQSVGFDPIDLQGDINGILARASQLPPGSVVLFLTFDTDRAGHYVLAGEVLQRVLEAANQPTFVIRDKNFGSGAVGGVVADLDVVGEQAGAMLGRVLAGERPADIPIQRVAGTRKVVDARALLRWGVPLSRVPPDALVSFQTLSAWERYRWWIAGIACALAAQFGVIAILFLERRRRLAAECAAAAAVALEQQVTHLNRVASVGEMATSIVHEVAQPLTAIRSNASAVLSYLAQEPPALASAREAMDDVVSDVQRATDVMRRVRAFARKGEERHRPISINAVAEDAARLVERTAESHGVALTLHLADDVPNVLGDDVQLVQVTLNLLTNAIDAAAASERRREVTVGSARGSGGVELTIDDTGRGFGPGDPNRLFDPFVTTKRDGLGLGLPIVRSLVHAHGGRLRMEAAPSGGARVRVILPALAGDVGATRRPADRGPADRGPADRGPARPGPAHPGGATPSAPGSDLS